MTIVDCIREGLPEFASKTAIIDGDATWTHAEMYERVDRLSQALLSSGAGKGEAVMAWLPNCHEAIEAELACFQIGAIWVTLNAQLTWPEVRIVMNATSPAVLIASPELFARIDTGDPDNPPSLSKVRCLITGPGEHNTTCLLTASYEDAINASQPERPRISVEESDIARLRYTSGTTGKAKAAILPHSVYLAMLENLQRALHPLDSTDRALHAAPLTHATASLMYPVFAAGGAQVILPRFDAENALETIEEQRITTMFAVPTILKRFTTTPAFQDRDLSSLRSMVYGGAPMPQELIVPLVQRLGTALLQIYGLSEAPFPITFLGHSEHRLGNPKLDSIGKPSEICDLRIVDDDGHDLPGGEVGEILVRGPNVMSGYWKDAEETRRTLKDGWLATGDMGYCDPEGYYHIVDRKKHVIISGGFNVYTSEVELILNQHPAVHESAVIGVPHAEWGEMVHAIIVPESGQSPTKAELTAHCRAQLAPYKTPKDFTFQQAPLPKSNSGKILKTELSRGHFH